MKTPRTPRNFAQPFGYKMMHGRWVALPREAKIVRAIFDEKSKPITCSNRPRRRHN